ncbi:fumarate reductase/succinate dehydrogenase flavoprotein domain protein [Clostridium sp. DL-VIII]|uniref:NAD(P)/FAD-dependent oxidoreductase n=1 Tax=Clostridium sp. DL-VIII TaxID=641107 RepID=UPI00023AF706|nr:NAD(P)/FAD-dependent oxidoreductase [Clostridium sp. DL-VIII]EHI97397.1 fumarate reductase/succinate dehydrogenase flavoprotein domain protein [Clostridium sp. DL-VIII]
MPDYDLIIVGAGIAGMTAAIGAAKEGIKKVLIIEKESSVGGLINQCIHNGFGKRFLNESVTGPEYVDFIERQLNGDCIEVILNTTVLDVTREKVITYVNSKDGVKEITAGAIIFAMGAKEKYSGNVVIPTNGLTGIFTVAEAHRIINLEGYLPGRNTIILAKDKWGFIVARRLIIEGGNIEGIVIEKSFKELADEEIHEIIEGFDIPIIENSRITEIEGETRIKKLKIVNLNNQVVEERNCDSLLLSVGYLPEISILKKLNINIDKRILGPEVADFQTSVDGFFACGNIIYGENALHMEETDGIECGVKASQYIKKYIY